MITALRCPAKAALICQVIALGSFFSVPSPVIAQTRAQRDSINAHATAVAALRFFEYRHSTLVRSPGAKNLEPMVPIFAVCEIAVGDFCYGPTNGGLSFGGIGTTPYTQQLAPARFSKQYWKVSGQIIDIYKNGVKRELKKIPGDVWLNGELVRIDVERGDYVRAMESAMACKSEKWWCNALRAYITHMSGMWVRADSAWNVALESMPLAEKCAWLDPSPATASKEFHQMFAAADCATQVQMANRVWWISDPFYTINGNERRSAHLSRIVELILSQWYRSHAMMTPAMSYAEKDVHSVRPMLIRTREGISDPTTTSADGTLSRAITLYVARFGYPELVMRVGAPTYTAKEEESVRLVAQYPTNRAAFVPDGSALVNHLRADVDAWDVNDPRAFEFMSDWMKPIRDIEYQVAHFRRATESRIIVATDVTPDSLLEYKWLAGRAYVARDYDAPMAMDDQYGRNVLQFDVTAPRDSALLSIELLESEGLTARARLATGPPPMPTQRFALSDLLLYEAGDALAPNLDDAMLRVKGTTRLAIGSSTGVFWEMYGVRPSEQPRLTVSVVPTEPGVLGRIAEVLKLRQSRDTLSISWQDPPAGGSEIESRAINLDLGRLGVGVYTMLLTAELPGQEKVVSKRIIEISPPGRRER